MAGEWRDSTWGEEISLEYGKRLRGYADAEGSVRVFGTNGPVGWTDESLAPGPGVIVGRKGAYRGVRYSPDPFFVIDTAYYIVPKRDLDMRWLYYAIIHYKLTEINDGSPIPSTTRAAVYVRELQVPQIEEQRTIAEVLGSLDDKIELNRRMNRVLEAMARAIFKAWFIDFEPVKAKAAGATSFRGMPQAVFDQLPDQLTETEFGPIPKGWKVKVMDDLFEINPRRPLKKGEVAPYLAMTNMPTQGHAPAHWEERAFGSGMRFENGDTLVARITPCLENGKTAFVDFLPPDLVGWGSTEYIVLRPRPPLPPVYAYCLARTPDFRNFAIANMTGTSGRQRVAASSLTHFPTVRPADAVAVTFGELVEPMFALAAANQAESRTLAAIRDTLLPKLISGDVPVLGAKGGPDGQ